MPACMSVHQFSLRIPLLPVLRVILPGQFCGGTAAAAAWSDGDEDDGGGGGDDDVLPAGRSMEKNLPARVLDV